ncbi:MAG: hypothetical protein SFU20_05020 [Chitinophagaceae bacterium]|nr:hypothetical protein [Chitinophagaceae bacterium]
MRRLVLIWFLLPIAALAQDEDSLENERLARMITLSELVMRSDLSIPKFIDRIKKDTTFYKAFRNLRVLGFTSLNDIRMLDKKGHVKASLQSRTKQLVKNGCRSTEVLEEQTTGDFYDGDRDYNYYTAELYASLFFAKGTICGENNIVKGHDRQVKEKKGLDKRKEQLKMLFFDPGKKIPGIPFMGGKTAIFDEHMSERYDYSLDMTDQGGQSCYLFTITAKEGYKGKVVIDRMVTWFDANSLEILARHYSLSYDTGIYDFEVSMEVQLTHFGNLLVPRVLKYNGTWDVPMKKRERAVFTATLFDFNR